MKAASLGSLGLSWSAIFRHCALAAAALSCANAVAMKAETTRRLLLPAWARALRIVWTRQRCQVAFISLATAALIPSWASETTSLTPRNPRRRSLRELDPERLGFGRTDVHAQHFAPAVRVDADRDDDRDRDDAVIAADFDVSRVEPDIGPIAFERPIEKGFDPRVDLLAQAADLALGDACSAHRLDQVVDGTCRDPLDIGLLDHRRQRLLGHAARLQETREVGALAQLGNAQLHRSGARLPVAIAVAVALRQPVRRALAMPGAGLRADLQLHQPLGGEGDHVAKNIRVGGLLHESAKVHHLVGHWGSSNQVGSSNPTLPENRQ